ncbi:winged helix-turn-helix domain-containing protein [Nocardiopsis dassonvillei]|uniref:helix-turn-helix domain-containing protein n=1 Tax=Nocardiopsis dassonvillei TaxID=2014 RepID=UPI0033EFB610
MTLARFRRVIAETFGMAYADLSGVWRLLHRMGWTNQLSACQGVEHDEEAIADWVEHIWAPAGQTPILHVAKGPLDLRFCWSGTNGVWQQGRVQHGSLAQTPSKRRGPLIRSVTGPEREETPGQSG